jgi:hypothetical protein
VGRQSNFVSVIATLSILALVYGSAQAQPQGRNGHREGPVHRQPEFKSTRDRWFSLSPEDRQTFRRNAERWMQMGPEERNRLREREQLHRDQLKREADKALRDAGLRLDQERRDLFEQRYLQERRRIERELRQEAEAKRHEQLPALQERLKKEFQETSPAGSSTTSPATSVTPKK